MDDIAPAELTLIFPAEEQMLSLARHVAAETARLWSRPDLAYSVELVVSELGTNSVRAAPGRRIRLGLALRVAGILVEVWDPSPSLPAVPHPADLDALCGRGLHIVQMLSAEHGVTPTPDQGGKIIWSLIATNQEIRDA